MNFFQAHGPKTMKLFITKSCGDAKLELFPGARPPDTTFTSWYDLTLALVWNIQHLVSSRTHWDQKNWQPGGHGHKSEETKIPRQENPISVEEREDNAW